MNFNDGERRGGNAILLFHYTHYSKDLTCSACFGLVKYSTPTLPLEQLGKSGWNQKQSNFLSLRPTLCGPRPESRKFTVIIVRTSTIRSGQTFESMMDSCPPKKTNFQSSDFKEQWENEPETRRVCEKLVWINIFRVLFSSAACSFHRKHFRTDIDSKSFEIDSACQSQSRLSLAFCSLPLCCVSMLLSFYKYR